MDERRSIFRRPRRQAFFLILIVLIVYLLLLGPQGMARDIMIGEGYAFVSFGEHGGLKLFSLVNPLQPVEVGSYDTPGSAERLARVGSLVYIADGAAGLRVVDVSDPRSPSSLGSVQVEGEARDLKLDGAYAYLATGTGLQVVDISNPNSPFSVGSLVSLGEARALDLHTVIVHMPGADPGSPGQVVGRYVILAGGSHGMQVIDVELPISPMKVGSFDPPWEAQDIRVLASYAFVAAGEAGLRIVDISNPFEPLEIGWLDTTGEVISIEIFGPLALLADGHGGVSLVDISTPAAPALLSRLDTPGTAQALGVNGHYLYVADGLHGVRIIDFSNLFSLYEAGMIETSGEASLRQLGQAGPAILGGDWGSVDQKVWQTFLFIGMDLLLLLASLFFFLAFFVQFVLPVRTLQERSQAIQRLLTYLRGRHGPALFVQDGIVHQRHREESRRGPGVVLLDTASAAVLRNPHAFTRAVGPGIVFTHREEYLAGTLDLHRQIRSLGPHENEDPFQPVVKDERSEAFAERQKRRYTTSGLTRDGVEIVPNISASFGLSPEHLSGNSRFGFTPQAVWLAIARQGVSPDDLQVSHSQHLSWIWLPPHLAADLWREYLRKFTLDELFSLPDPSAGQLSSQPHQTALDVIRQMVHARLTMREVPELDEFGRRTGSLKPSKEFRILREHGLKVYSAELRQLRIPQSVEEQIIEDWSKTWLQRARSEYSHAESLHETEKLASQNLALMEYATAASLLLAPSIKQSQTAADPDMQATLRLLLRGTLKLCLREAQLQPYLTNQVSALTEIIEWTGQVGT